MHDKYYTEVDVETLHRELVRFTKYIDECHSEADDVERNLLVEKKAHAENLIDFLEQYYDCTEE